MIQHLIIYFLAFIGIWVGAGFALKSVEHISKLLRASSFAVSFLILGFFTSVSELSVGLNSLILNDPEIYVGNLIGASIVIFLLIIPLLAATGNGIKINSDFQGFNLLLSVIVIAMPGVLAMDGTVDRIDGLIAVVLYLFLLFSIQSRKGILQNVNKISKSQSLKIAKDLAKIIAGIAIIFISARIVVDQTMYFSNLLNVSPFLISLLVIAIGTNIPELSFVVRSIFMQNKEAAFGDYVGSAAFNTFIFGFLTLYYGSNVILTNSYFISLIFLTGGLLAFYLISKTEHFISRIEGFLLLMIYVVFLSVEVFSHVFKITF